MTIAPTGEIGSLSVLPTWGVLAGMDPNDPPPFQFPQRVVTVERMRVDPQIDALCNSVTMPIMRYRWQLDPNGARDEVVEQIATDFGIPIKGATEVAPRSRRRFKHKDHLEHALLALWHGFMFFEQVPDTDRFDLAVDGWRLRKLAPRMPSTIDRIHIADDGGLAGITQYGYRPPPPRPGRNPFQVDPQIPVNALAAYVWRREGANWHGRSMLRPLYRDWVLKDRALRVDAIKNERFGVGIPVAKAPEGGDPVQYAKMAQAVRASELSGVGLPAGGDIGVEGIRGTLPDVMASIRYYDESMARAFMAMVIQLGQTQTGSRALGNTFADFFQMLVEAVADWYKDTTNEHVIEDYVDWNWGEDEQAPLLEWSYAEHTPLAVADLVSMVQAGVITMDRGTEEVVRQTSQLPALPEDEERPTTLGNPSTPPASVAASRRPFEVAARKQMVDDPAIGHRQRNAIELAAKTDFEQLQERWQDATSSVVDDWKEVQRYQIDALVEQVKVAVESGNAVALASLSAPIEGQSTLAAAMREMAEDAIVGAKEEAREQGVSIGVVNLDDTVGRQLDQRAEATASLLARGLSESASRAAINLGTSALSPEEVAAAVRDHLEGLTDTFLNDMLGGALTQAQNTGRRAVMSERPATIYASELLDGDTCTRCSAVDGREYSSLEEAEADYPTGGHKNCLGGPRCRGTLVAVYSEGVEASAVRAHLPGKHSQKSHGSGGTKEFSTHEDAQEWVDGAGAGWMDGLSASERSGVEAYTDIGGSFKANDALRGGADPKTVKLGDADADALDAAIRRSSFEEDVVVWRGSQTGASKAWDWSDNPDPGFVSTAASKETAEAYLDVDDPGHTLYKITIKAGSPAAAIHSDLSAVGEAEVLLPRNTQVKMGTISKRKNRAAVVEVEIGG